MQFFMASQEFDPPFDSSPAKLSQILTSIRESKFFFYFLFILNLSTHTNIKSKYLQEELKGKSDFVYTTKQKKEKKKRKKE